MNLKGSERIVQSFDISRFREAAVVAAVVVVVVVVVVGGSDTLVGRYISNLSIIYHTAFAVVSRCCFMLPARLCVRVCVCVWGVMRFAT